MRRVVHKGVEKTSVQDRSTDHDFATDARVLGLVEQSLARRKSDECCTLALIAWRAMVRIVMRVGHRWSWTAMGFHQEESLESNLEAIGR